MSDTSFSTAYIELDCLFDTRLAVIYSLDEEAATRLVQANYFDRQTDRFTGIDLTAYQQRYAVRDKSVLLNAIRTPMLRMLQEYVVETKHQSQTSPFKYEPKIVVNTFPYVITDEEARVIIDALIKLTNKAATIELVHFPMEDLTPKKVKADYSLLCMYDYWKWIEHHSQTGDFKEVTCPEVTLLGPMLYFNGIPKRETIEKAKSLQTTPFGAMEMLAGPLIDLKLLPIRNFCAAFTPKRPTSS